MEGKDQYRDIYSIGLKTLISDVHDDMGGLVCQKLIAKFLNGIEKSTNESIRREAIDLVAALLTRFGNLLDINEITAVLLRQLAEAGRRPVLKRVSSCFGALAVAASETQLAHVVQALLDKVQETSSSKRQDGHILGSVQTLGIVTRSVGYRLGKLADKLVPIFLNFCGDPNDLEQESEEMNEIRDYCFLGLESIALRCPRDLEPLLTTVVETTLQFLKYDPNYSYGEVDDADDKDSGDDYDADGNGDEDEEFQGSDDDDTSWKVRKNAVKVMRAIVTTQPVLSDSVANAFASSLLLRFKEREENVRIDVIHCYHELMSKLSTASASEGDVTSVHLASFFSHSFKLLSITGESAAKTKSALFSAIKLLATIRKGDLKPFVSTLIDKIYVALVDKNQVLRLDALLCLRALHESLNPVILTPFAHTSLPLVISCVDADWFRLISEGLRTLNALLKSLESIEKTPATVSMIKKVYTCLIPTLEASDIDIEVKECALQLTGTLFAEYAELLRPELASALQLLKKRLDNDVTRLSTLKTISAIAACSSTLPELIQFLEDTARTLSQLLRQQNRQIQLFALLCLESLVMRSDMKLSEATSETLRAEVSFLFSDSDLQLCSLSLQLFKNLLRLLPLSQQPLYSDIYKRIINLTISPLVGPTQQTLVMLFKDLVSSPENGLESESLLHDLYVAGDTELPSTTAKQSIQNLAKCIAAVCMHSSPQKKDASIKKFVQDIQLEQPAGQTGHARLIALFALGEIGLHMDLFGVEHLNELLLQGLESSSDENKNTTALCLGRIAVGNLASYLNCKFSHNTSHACILSLLVLLIIFETNINISSLYFHFI